MFFNYKTPFYAVLLHTLKSAHRDKLFLGTVGSLFFGAFASFFLGNLAIVESKQMQAVYMANISRFIIVSGLILFVSFHVQRMFDTKEINLVLSRAIDRSSVIISLWVSFILLSIPSIALATVILSFVSNGYGLLAWSVTMCMEVWIVISLCLFFALLIRGLMLATMISIGAYIASRIVGFFVAYININHDIKEWYLFERIIAVIMKIVSVLIPRLDLYAKSTWLVYGVSDYVSIYISILQACIFIPLILLATIDEFTKKDF